MSLPKRQDEYHGISDQGGYPKCSEKSVGSGEDTSERPGEETLFTVQHFSHWIQPRTEFGT